MSGHTPGPWFYDEECGDVASVASVDGRHRYITMACGHPDTGESVANARLIAAAPEMLEALLGMVEAAGPDFLCCCRPTCDRECRAVVAARAALAKVEGT
jgi:hypothetical protein